MSNVQPLSAAFDQFPDADPMLVAALVEIVTRELADDDHRRRQAELSHEHQLRRLKHVARMSVKATAADRRVPFDQREPRAFPKDILATAWAIFEASGDIVAQTRLEEAEGRNTAWRVLVQRDSDTPALYRAPYWIGGFEGSKGMAEGRAAAKITNLVRDGFEVLTKVETTNVRLATLEEAEARSTEIGREIIRLEREARDAAKTPVERKPEAQPKAKRPRMTKAKPTRTRGGAWANMTDEEVSAEISRRWIKRRKTMAAKKAAEG